MQQQDETASASRSSPVGVSSTAAIRGHPIHPTVIPFPLAFLAAPLAADLGYWWTGDPFWARASVWLLGAGVVTGGFAAVFGIADFLTIKRVRRLAKGWTHAVGNAAVLALAVVSLVLRFDDAASAVLPLGLVLSVVIAALLGLTAWAGGELSYRHGIGLSPEALRPDGARPEGPAQDSPRRP